MSEHKKGFYVPTTWMIVAVLVLIAGAAVQFGSSLQSASTSSGISDINAPPQPVPQVPASETNGIVMSTTPKPQKGTLKLLKKYGSTRLPPFGEMQNNRPSYQYLEYKKNGLQAFAKISSMRKVSDTRIGLSTMDIKMPAGIVIRLLDNSGNYVFCKKDQNPEIGCYYYKFWMEMGEGETRDEMFIGNEAKEAIYWEVSIYGSLD